MKYFIAGIEFSSGDESIIYRCLFTANSNKLVEHYFKCLWRLDDLIEYGELYLTPYGNGNKLIHIDEIPEDRFSILNMFLDTTHLTEFENVPIGVQNGIS